MFFFYFVAKLLAYLDLMVFIDDFPYQIPAN